MTDDIHQWLKTAGKEFKIRVTPKASSNRIKIEKMPDGTTRLRVYVTVAAESGKANEAVLKLLSKALSVPKTKLVIVRGELSTDKILKLI